MVKCFPYFILDLSEGGIIDSKSNYTMTKKCIVLTSSMANQLGTVNQRNMIDKLTGKKSTLREIEAVNPDHHDRRNELTAISGKKGDFPQLFLWQMTVRPPTLEASRSSMIFSRPTPCPRMFSSRTQTYLPFPGYSTGYLASPEIDLKNMRASAQL